MCDLYRGRSNHPADANERLVLYFHVGGSQARPIRLSFDSPGQNAGTIYSSPRPSDTQMRALMMGESWEERACITRNYLAEEWLLNRELIVYGASGYKELPLNQSIVAALERGGKACDEDNWRGPFVVVAARRLEDSWQMVAGRTPGQPDAGSAGAIVEDATPWDYRQVLNFAIRPLGLGGGTIAWIPRIRGMPSVESPPEDAEFGEKDFVGVDGLDDSSSEGSGVQVEAPSPSDSWVSRRAASPAE